MPTWRELLFGCVGAVIGAAAVGVAASHDIPEQRGQDYDRCLATGRDKTACDAMVRLLKHRDKVERCYAAANDNQNAKELCRLFSTE
jgi:hypothetical protein